MDTESEVAMPKEDWWTPRYKLLDNTNHLKDWLRQCEEYEKSDNGRRLRTLRMEYIRKWEDYMRRWVYSLVPSTTYLDPRYAATKMWQAAYIQHGEKWESLYYQRDRK